MTKQGQGRALDSLSGYFRRRRNKQLKDLIERCVVKVKEKESRPFRILDLGGSVSYWKFLGFDFLERHDIHVVCSNYTESELSEEEHPRITKMVADARNMSDVSSKQFDLVHSNSVIEHVGRYHDMISFGKEVKRVGTYYYVQSPYFWFPIDPHFPRLPLFHWMPANIRCKLLKNFKIGWGRPAKDVALAMNMVEGTFLLDRSQFNYIFDDATISFEWFILPKSLIAIREH